jgi:hypothetical protein
MNRSWLWTLVIETSRDIDRAVRNIVNVAFDKAQAILTESRETLEVGARDDSVTAQCSADRPQSECPLEERA